MSASFTPLVLATLAFVGSHFIISTEPLRGMLARAIGARNFLIVYSLIAIVTFVWMNVAYARAPFEDLWGDPIWARWLAVLVMPLPAVLLVAGVTTASPTALYPEPPPGTDSPNGIQKVTRHPVMSAIAIWAALHLMANGDLASLIFFGGFLVLTVGGMAHLDARRAATGGEAWTRFAAATSAVPFAAIIAGRARVGLGEIGWNRIAVGLALYVILLLGHRVVIDVPLLPGLVPR